MVIFHSYVKRLPEGNPIALTKKKHPDSNPKGTLIAMERKREREYNPQYK